VCTMTALVIIMTGAWSSGETGAALSAMAFGQGVTGGSWVVTFGMVIFAFTTIIAWSYYGERCAEYLFGVKVITPYRWAWVVLLFVGAVGNLGGRLPVVGLFDDLVHPLERRGLRFPVCLDLLVDVVPRLGHTRCYAVEKQIVS